MLDHEVYDAHLQHFLQRKIEELPISEQVILKNIHGCNKKINYNVDGVYLLRNSSKQTKLHGLCTCKNSFVCPVCSARIMKRHKTNIGIALDTLSKKGYHAVMITLTIPHLNFQSCKEVQDILYASWRAAFAGKGTKRPNNRWATPINKFWVECGIEYHIRVSEFTYGKNGFNPHFHMLVWTKQPIAKMYAYEKDIEAYWMKKIKEVTKKWQIKNNCYDEQRYNSIFAHEALGISIHISDHEAHSSEYITGWGEDSELTGNVQKKASHENHYTPYQILTMAEHDSKMWEVYRQFAINVCRKPVHRRVEYSKGLHQIIVTAKNTGTFIEITRKKKLAAKWEIVGWFPRNEWSKLCELNKKFPIISNILYLAKENEDILNDYLAFYEITMSKIQTFYYKLIQDLYAA